MDVAVVGAGPAGSTIASLLARRGWAVAILVPPPLGRQRTAEVMSPRCVQAIGRCMPAAVLEDAAVVRSCSGVESRWFSANARCERFEPAAAYLVDRAALDSRLLDAAGDSGAQVVHGRVLREAQISQSSVRLAGTHAGGRCWSLDAGFVVDATGRSSLVARRIGVQRHCLVRQVAVLGHAGTTPRGRGGNWFKVESGLGGWWTAAPAPESGWELVHYIPAIAPKPDRSTLARRFRSTRLAQEIGELDIGTRASGMDASFSALDRVQGHRWAAIGDAAVAFDPIASQGLWHAIGSAGAAAAGIDQFLAGGGTRELAAYELRSFATLRHHARQLQGLYGENT